MWICLNNAFFSIVSKDCGEDELLVRARRPGDIEKIFGMKAKVTNDGDYHYRCVMKKEVIIAALAGEILTIDYDNFKNSVEDVALHQAYEEVWRDMVAIQPEPPYSGGWIRT